MKRGGKRTNKYIQLVKITGITGCVILALFVILILAQLFRQEEEPVNREQSSISGQELPVTEDRVVLVGLDNDQVTFFDVDGQKEIILTMDGSTYIYDKYGQAMSSGQLETGAIMDISYQRSQGYLYSMQYSRDAWEFTGIDNFSLNLQKQELTIGKSIYRLVSGTRGFSGEAVVELSQIHTGDILTVRGMGQDVWSIRVDNGHGYLILENEEDFVGGWIEVGQSIIRSIREDMRISVPEGSHEVTISYRGYMDTRSVEIKRNQETIMDVSDLADTIIKRGKVYFNVTPSDAKVYIDGILIDTSRLIEMEYGLHQIVATANGYDTLTRYFRLEGESASLDVTLQLPEETETSDEEDEDSSDSSESSESSSTSDSSESSESSSTSHSSESTDGSEPSESSTPTESSEPSESSTPTESSEPSESSEPTQSSEPSESSEPTQSSEPSESSEPTQSSEPSESSTPTQSSESSESSTPSDGSESQSTTSV